MDPLGKTQIACMDVPQGSAYFRDQPAFVDGFSGRTCRTALVFHQSVHKPTGSWTATGEPPSMSHMLGYARVSTDDQGLAGLHLDILLTPAKELPPGRVRPRLPDLYTYE